MNRGTPERNLQVEGSNAPGKAKSDRRNAALVTLVPTCPPRRNTSSSWQAVARHRRRLHGAVTRTDDVNRCSTQSRAVPSSQASITKSASPSMAMIGWCQTPTA